MASTGLACREDEWKIVTNLVLDGISSCHTRRAYSQALEEFLIWFRDEPNRGATKATSPQVYDFTTFSIHAPTRGATGT